MHLELINKIIHHTTKPKTHFTRTVNQSFYNEKYILYTRYCSIATFLQH